jgi:uncharacterized membrane protein
MLLHRSVIFVDPVIRIYASQILLILMLTLMFLLVVQARHAQTREVVAIKKMSFQGKQSTEVRYLFCDAVSIDHIAYKYNILDDACYEEENND